MRITASVVRPDTPHAIAVLLTHLLLLVLAIHPLAAAPLSLVPVHQLNQPTRPLATPGDIKDYQLPQPTTPPAFEAVVSRSWPAGLIPLFLVERDGHAELRRRPARGQENFTEPLFFAAPIPAESHAAALAGFWIADAQSNRDSKNHFGIELTLDGDQVAARFDPQTDYRFGFITAGTFRTNQLELAVEYIMDKFHIVGTLAGNRLTGTWKHLDDPEEGTWVASRQGALDAIPDPHRLAPLHAWRHTDHSTPRYETGERSPGAGWTRTEPALCLVWTSATPPHTVSSTPTTAAAAKTPAAVPLALDSTRTHDLTLTTNDTGFPTVRTTGGDPYLFTQPTPQPVDLKTTPVLAFESFSTTGTDHLQVFLVPPTRESHSITAAGVAPSEGWSTTAVDLSELLNQPLAPIDRLRLDFGTAPGRTVQVRNLQLRAPSAAELALKSRRDQARQLEQTLDSRLHDYLNRSWPAQVDQVLVASNFITVRGSLATTPTPRSNLRLAEIPIHADPTDPHASWITAPISIAPNGAFTASIPRFLPTPPDRDRLFSRWAVARVTPSATELLSAARYADDFTPAPATNLPPHRPRSAKGLGALWTGRPLEDLDLLGISAVTVNIRLDSFMRLTPGPGRAEFRYAGQSWYLEDSYLAALDKVLGEATRRSILVSAIILIPQAKDFADLDYGRRIAHPDAAPAGIYVMPNVADPQGHAAYAAALEALAQRYGRPNSAPGRIHHWILHNEVDMGWIWTNAGEKTARRYLDLYQRSMRTAHLIARQYDPQARTFISLTHHWNDKVGPNYYNARQMLELLLDFCRAEGDFEWAIAYHPYPQDLRNPRTWEDTEATFSLDTPRITYRNLEVLDAWVRQPRTLFQGKTQRVVHLTEQGLNSPDYSEASLRDQAAGMAYAWNKMKRLPSISLFHYHNWVDNRHEGGLRIGLRKFPDDPADPHGKKPVWTVYRALGTPDEPAATAFALEVTGLRSWDAILHPTPIR